MDKRKSIENLFARYLNNECSPGEVEILLQHFGVENNDAFLRKLIRGCMESSINAATSDSQEIEDLLNNTFLKIKEKISRDESEISVHIMPRKRAWLMAAATTVSFLLLSIAGYFLLNNKKENHLVATHKVLPVNDIAPGRNNAILTLDNGRIIVLDSAGDGTLAQQGNTDVQKINGQIAYHKTGITTHSKPVYNTITTANANQYQLILTDGSKVWLNAASSIRFPASFTGKERKVTITGEVYFEIAKDATRPFKVDFKNRKGANEEIEVLGTHFNVNAYLNEPEMATTLLEGSVKIKNGDDIKRLTPGQQARITSKGIEIKNNINEDQVVAWKDGYFLFDDTDIYTLMRQVERWYNVQVNFYGKVTEDGFSGKISRNVSLSNFIKVLQLNDIKIRTQGRTIIVGK